MRLIDADALIEIFDKDEYERVRNEYQSGYNDGLLHAEVVADDQPTVDAVPVIRCKDCAYYRPYSDGRYDCDNMLGMADVDEDGFCSRAERKE